jgi:hypothetical protein
MLTKYPSDFSDIVLSNAEHMHVDQPVVLILEDSSPEAQRVARDLVCDGVCAKTLINLFGSASVLVSKADACKLLRRYGWSGGEFLATKMEATCDCDFHVVALMEAMGMAPVKESMETERFMTKYHGKDHLHVTADQPSGCNRPSVRMSERQPNNN